MEENEERKDGKPAAVNDNTNDAAKDTEGRGIPVSSLSFLSEIRPDFWD